MTKEIEITVLPNDTDTDDPDFVAPSNFFFRNSLGDYCFLHTRSRKKATEWLDKEYGKGFFKIRTIKIESTNNPVTVRGVETR